MGATGKKDSARLVLPDGRIVEAQEPVIVSASRSTDLPAFYSDWFFRRLEEGYSIWKNPFNGQEMYISYAKTRFIVFWSKNPRPLLSKLDLLKKRGIGCYVQFTLNDYVSEGLEPNVPALDGRIGTFKALVDKLGKGGAVWRNDPLVLTDKMGVDELLAKAERIGDALQGYTEKLVFSFMDDYKRTRENLKEAGIVWKPWTEDLMNAFVRELVKLNSRWGFNLATCAEKIDFDSLGVRHNSCVDQELIVRRAYADKALMEHLGVDVVSSLMGMPGDLDLGGGLYARPKKKNKDAGQREACGCVKSKDIGQYNTCMHLCAYCYANDRKRSVQANHERHMSMRGAERIAGTR